MRNIFKEVEIALGAGGKAQRYPGAIRPGHRLGSAPATVLIAFLCLAAIVTADEPAVSYIFPAGGQRGTKVDFRVGGMYLHEGAAFEMFGPGVLASSTILPTNTAWFEGPLVPLPASQQKEDYPKDYAGHVDISTDALLGIRHWRVSTSQGATPSMKFVVGELPELVEAEIEGEPVPVAVTLPLTINGRIFPREDADDWTFTAKQGELIRAEVTAARLGSPLEARLVLYDSAGRPLAEDVGSLDGDACLHATIPADGNYRLRIHDVNFSGLQHFVYRLTLTSGPNVEHVYPLGGRRGDRLKLQLQGEGLPAEAIETAIPSDAPSWYVVRPSIASGAANALGLDVDDLPELLESEPNDTAPQAVEITAPAIGNGRVDTAGDRDLWSFRAVQNESLEFGLAAARLGSPLAAVLTIEDANSKELARAEESPTTQSDTRLRFTAPQDGVYFVRVTDRFTSRGGPSFAYRLRVTPPDAGNFKLTLASDALTLYRGSQAKLRVMAERSGLFTGAINLAVDGLPPGVTAQATQIAVNQPQAEITFKAEGTCKIEAKHLTVKGAAEIAGQQVARVATLPFRMGEMPVDDVLLAVSMPTPFEVQGQYDLTFAPRGSVLKRHYNIKRNAYDGPLTVQLADRQARHLQGVTGKPITVPAGATECDYPVFLPSWMELGRTSRSVVMAVGVVTDADGSRHTVSFTSQNQNEQIVALVAPCELGIQTEKSSLSCSAGGDVEVAVRVSRARSLTQPAKMELVVPPHIRGISAEPVVIPAGADHAVLKIHCDGEFGPLNMPVTIRATIDRDDRPVVAETKLELVSGTAAP